jgi:hypothetical protein
VQQLHGWAREAGRDPGAITLSVRVPMEVRPQRLKSPAGERPLFQGTAEELIADIRAYVTAGVTHFVWDFTQQDLRLVLENLERFAHEVRPKLVGRPHDPTVGAGAVRSGRNAGGPARGARGSARAVNRRGSARASTRRRQGSR